MKFKILLIIVLLSCKSVAQNAESFFNNGLKKMVAGDDIGAISEYSKAINMNPNYLDPYISRGISKIHLGDFNGAIRDFNLVINKSSINDKQALAVAYSNRGLANKLLKRNVEAVSDYTKSISYKDDVAAFYSGRGEVKVQLDDYRGAILDFNKAISINPKDGTDFNNRGVAKYLLQDKNGACLDWSRAGELGFYDAYNNIKTYCK